MRFGCTGNYKREIMGIVKSNAFAWDIKAFQVEMIWTQKEQVGYIVNSPLFQCLDWELPTRKVTDLLTWFFNIELIFKKKNVGFANSISQKCMPFHFHYFLPSHQRVFIGCPEFEAVIIFSYFVHHNTSHAFKIKNKQTNHHVKWFQDVLWYRLRFELVELKKLPGFPFIVQSYWWASLFPLVQVHRPFWLPNMSGYIDWFFPNAFKKILLIDLRQRESERERVSVICCSPYWCTHWLVLF